MAMAYTCSPATNYFDYNAVTTRPRSCEMTREAMSVSDEIIDSAQFLADVPGLPSNPSDWTNVDKLNWIQTTREAYDLSPIPDDVLPNLSEVLGEIDLEKMLAIEDNMENDLLNGLKISDFDILKSDLMERWLSVAQPKPIASEPFVHQHQQQMPPQSMAQYQYQSQAPPAMPAPVYSAPVYSTPMYSTPVYSAPELLPVMPQLQQPNYVYSHQQFLKPEPVYSPQELKPFHSQSPSYQYLEASPSPMYAYSAPASSSSSSQQTHFQFPPASVTQRVTSQIPSAIPPYSPLLARAGHHGSLSSLVDSASSSAYTTDEEDFFEFPAMPSRDIPTISVSGETTNHPLMHSLAPGLVAIPINPKTGKPKRKRRKKVRSSIVPPPLLPNQGANCSLWEFFLELLHDPAHYQTLIKWVNHDQGEFKIIDSEVVSVIWGLLKNKATMKYDHMSRSIRYYYGKDILDKVPEKQLVYRFGANSNWLHYQPKSQGLDITRMPTAPIEICGRIAKPKCFAVARIGSPLS
eukprot:m.140548 g.140548  ORF g.140548 m.140548 type:complete len:519 (+) comp38318_c1_seq1:196-1752(+)